MIDFAWTTWIRISNHKTISWAKQNAFQFELPVIFTSRSCKCCSLYQSNYIDTWIIQSSNEFGFHFVVSLVNQFIYDLCATCMQYVWITLTVNYEGFFSELLNINSWCILQCLKIHCRSWEFNRANINAWSSGIYSGGMFLSKKNIAVILALHCGRRDQIV